MHACICVYMYINVGYIYCINLLLVLSCVCFRTMMTGRIHGRRPGALCLNRRRLRSAKRLRGSAARIRRRLSPTRRCPRTDSVVLRASCPQAVNTPSPATRRPAGQGQRRGRGPRRLLTAQKSTKWTSSLSSTQTIAARVGAWRVGHSGKLSSAPWRGRSGGSYAAMPSHWSNTPTSKRS